jgi:chemotaxis protein methyltransferase CheR
VTEFVTASADHKSSLSTPTMTPITERDFHRIRDLVASDTGVHLGSLKRDFLTARLGRRVRSLGMNSFREYVAKVAFDAGERAEMLDYVLDSGTRFFRESRHLEYLERLIPRWISDAHAGRRNRAARVWSAGCSTGQETLSIAMVLLAHVPGWTLEVVGSDLSARLLKQATSATFPMVNAQEIPPRYRRQFVLRTPDRDVERMTVCDRVRSIVRYRRINLHRPFPETGPFDVIFCCNVLHYFDPEARAVAIDRLIQRLAPGGYLFLGEHDEPIENASLRSMARSIYRAEAK